VSQILRKNGKLVLFLFCGSYFLRFNTIYWDLLWHTITNIISTCFIFGELNMVAKNAKIRLLRKKTDIRYHGKYSIQAQQRTYHCMFSSGFSNLLTKWHTHWAVIDLIRLVGNTDQRVGQTRTFGYTRVRIRYHGGVSIPIWPVTTAMGRISRSGKQNELWSRLVYLEWLNDWYESSITPANISLIRICIEIFSFHL
jgi:hypothetical protein